MLSTALVALDATIIATASATIARDLGSFAQVPWLFSAYLLAQAVSTPLFGRLADVLGRKRLMLAGVGFFLVGSALCGAAWSMPALIVGRVLQGLGAGAVMPVSLTIAADIYTLQERAKAQGYLASVWAISSVVGPTLGGVFSEFVSWRWIFWINLPLCFAAATMLVLKYHESSREGDREPIDYLGAALLTGGSTLVLLGLLEGGTSWAWTSAPSGLIFVVAVLLLVAFATHALRSAHPILNLRLLRRRVVAVPTAIALLIGVIVLGLSTYVPIYAQGILGVGPLIAGFALAAMMVGWPLAATNAGRVYLALGFRYTSMIGSVFVVLGTALTLLLGEHSSVITVGVFTFVIGLGMGLTAVPTLIAAQSSAEFTERGAITGINMFARSLGSAVGVAICGAIINARTTLAPEGPPTEPALMAALHLVFGLLAFAGIVIATLTILMPADSPKHRSAPTTEPDAPNETATTV